MPAKIIPRPATMIPIPNGVSKQIIKQDSMNLIDLGDITPRQEQPPLSQKAKPTVDQLLDLDGPPMPTFPELSVSPLTLVDYDKEPSARRSSTDSSSGLSFAELASRSSPFQQNTPPVLPSRSNGAVTPTTPVRVAPGPPIPARSQNRTPLPNPTPAFSPRMPERSQHAEPIYDTVPFNTFAQPIKQAPPPPTQLRPNSISLVSVL